MQDKYGIKINHQIDNDGTFNTYLVFEFAISSNVLQLVRYHLFVKNYTDRFAEMNPDIKVRKINSISILLVPCKDIKDKYFPLSEISKEHYRNWIDNKRQEVLDKWV